MPRKLRTHHKNSFYHVMLRGNFRQSLFFDDDDRTTFFEILKRAKNKYFFKIHLFCLMTNHIHLVIQVDHIPLSKIMQHISSVFALKINKKYRRVGHLFQGRFLAKLICTNDYLAQLCYYIHYNPVAAKIVSNVQEYPWTSHHCYSGKDILNWVTTDFVLNLLATIFNQDSSSAYLHLFSAECDGFFSKNIFKYDGEGNLSFVDVMTESINYSEKMDLSSWKLPDLIEVICEFLGVSRALIDSDSQNRSASFARSIIAYFAHYRANFTLTQLGIYFNRCPHTISRNMHRTFNLTKTREIILQIETRIMKDIVLNTTRAGK